LLSTTTRLCRRIAFLENWSVRHEAAMYTDLFKEQRSLRRGRIGSSSQINYRQQSTCSDWRSRTIHIIQDAPAALVEIGCRCICTMMRKETTDPSRKGHCFPRVLEIEALEAEEQSKSNHRPAKYPDQQSIDQQGRRAV
jgi:hypothetical protein